MSEKKSEKNKDALRITNQFRNRDAMVYDLRCEGARLTVTVAQRTSEHDLGEWHVEALAGGQPEETSVREWGPTRMDALQAVGRAWTQKLSDGLLPSFDWDAVGKVLLAVRAV